MPDAFRVQAAEEFEQTFRPGVRFLLSRQLGGSELDRAADEVLEAVRSSLRADRMPAEDVVRCVREKVRERAARCERPDATPAVQPGDVAAAKQILARLPEQQRAIVKLAYVERQTDAEIAERLGISTCEVAEVRRRVRGEFQRVRVQKEPAC